MIRLFDLGSLFRGRALNLFRDGALTIPGSVSAQDQESVLALLQQRGAPTPLERVEVDARDGLLQPAQTLLDRVVWEGRAGEVLLVLRDVADASLREALLADERVRAFRCVVLVVPPPGGGESLGAWGELLLAVRDAVRDAYAARCLDLRLNPAALDPWQDVIASLQNPCDAVALVNAVVDLQLEAVDLRRTAVVAHRVVMRELTWRAADEVVVLLALASGREALIPRELGEGVLEATKARLLTQQLWHPEDGLLGWASLLLDAECWEGALGTPDGLPSNMQRAEGWGAAHDDLCRHLGFFRYERPLPDASPFVRDAHRILQQLNDGEIAVALNAARGLVRRFPREDASVDAAWRYWALRAHLASVEARPAMATEYWAEAIGSAKIAVVRAETLGSLLVDACYAVRAHDVARALSLSQESVAALAELPAPNRTRGSALFSVCECLLTAQRPAEAVTYARLSLEERLAAGAPRAAVLWSRVALARALLSSDNFTEARGAAQLAEADRVGLRNVTHVLPVLLNVRAALALHDGELLSYAKIRHEWVLAVQAVGLLDESDIQRLREEARTIRDRSPELAQAVDTLVAEGEAALAARRLRPRP